MANWCYQLDGVAAQCTIAIDHILNQMFEDQWISSIGACVWPVRAPNNTPLNFY